LSGKRPAINKRGYPAILATVKSKNSSPSTQNIDTSNHQIKSPAIVATADRLPETRMAAGALPHDHPPKTVIPTGADRLFLALGF